MMGPEFEYVLDLLELERLKLEAHIRQVARNQDIAMCNIDTTETEGQLRQVRDALALLRTPDYLREKGSAGMSELKPWMVPFLRDLVVDLMDKIDQRNIEKLDGIVDAVEATLFPHATSLSGNQRTEPVEGEVGDAFGECCGHGVHESNACVECGSDLDAVVGHLSKLRNRLRNGAKTGTGITADGFFDCAFLDLTISTLRTLAAQVERLEELEEYMRHEYNQAESRRGNERLRAETAEAQRDRYRAALEEIQADDPPDSDDKWELAARYQIIAEKALEQDS